jgi:hypothetical protein
MCRSIHLLYCRSTATTHATHKQQVETLSASHPHLTLTVTSPAQAQIREREREREREGERGRERERERETDSESIASPADDAAPPLSTSVFSFIS